MKEKIPTQTGFGIAIFAIITIVQLILIYILEAQ